MKVLIYSPNIKLGQPLLRMFTQHGIVSTLVSGQESAALSAMTSQHILVILLEALGCTNNLTGFCSRLKSEGCTSAWMLLTQNQSLTRISRMQEAGIMMCHTLPFSYRMILEELYRLKETGPCPAGRILYSARFQVDLLARSVTCDGQGFPVTPRQFAILCYLIKEPGRLFSKAQIWDEVWGDFDYPVNNTIEVHIRRIRMKLPDPSIIQTVAGIGYRLRADC